MKLQIGIVLLALCGAAWAQNQEDKIVREVRGEGFTRYSVHHFPLQTQKGQRLNLERLDEDIKTLWRKGLFEDIGYRIEPVPGTDEVIVVIWVKEYPLVSDVRILGAKEIPAQKIYQVLRVQQFDVLNPSELKLDKEDIVAMYVEKGYHFAEIAETIEPHGPNVVLTYKIFEGPLVLVDEIIFTGTYTISKSELQSFMITKESGWFSRHPFVEKHLREDIERIKLYLRLEGFLDIYHGNNVFIEDVRFNDTKTYATILIHVREGPRYFVRNITFRGHEGLFTDEELRRAIPIQPGDRFSEQDFFRANQRLRDKYGEKAYLNVEIDANWVVVGPNHVDLFFTFKPNNRVSVGKIVIQGNTKTKEDRVRLNFRELAPGDELDTKRLQRAIQRLRDRGWFEISPRGVTYEYVDTGNPDVKDVLVNVREGQTARFQFAGGYSSSFGVIGLIEFTQRNFDLSDLPASWGELGEAWSGAGQFLRLRLAPGARRQAYSLEFREPYFFGQEVGMFLRGFNIATKREDWDELRQGGSFGFDKRFENLITGIAFRVNNIEVDDVEPTAPAIVHQFKGDNMIVSLEPSVAYDTRDSIIIPTEGWRGEISYEWAAEAFGGDFDFGKVTVEGQVHFPLLELESRARHVLSLKTMFGWVEPFRDTEDIPIFERFFAGGRDSIRGFEFRGVGPMENGDPIGGTAVWVNTMEYTIPVYEQSIFFATWYDIGTIALEPNELTHEKFRSAAGFGFRFVIPALGNIPVALDFGFVLNRADSDEKQFVLFDLGRFF